MTQSEVIYLAAASAGDTAPITWTINPALRIALAIGIVIFYAVLFVMLKRKTLILKYTLLWMLSGLVLVVFLLFPSVVILISWSIGVSNPVNAVFLFFAGFALLLILSLTSIVSQLSDKNRTLTQSMALLEKRLRDLENTENTTDAEKK